MGIKPVRSKTPDTKENLRKIDRILYAGGLVWVAVALWFI